MKNQNKQKEENLGEYVKRNYMKNEKSKLKKNINAVTKLKKNGERNKLNLVARNKKTRNTEVRKV